MPGHNFIHEDSIIRSKKLIDGGDLGRLVAIYVMYHIHHPLCSYLRILFPIIFLYLPLPSQRDTPNIDFLLDKD